MDVYFKNGCLRDKPALADSPHFSIFFYYLFHKRSLHAGYMRHQFLRVDDIHDTQSTTSKQHLIKLQQQT